MKFTNSKMVDYVRLSPNYSSRNGHKITKITIHHMAGNLSVETCGRVFSSKSRMASSNYGIDSDGRIGMYVEEKNRAWTSSSRWNDERAVTIEVANCKLGGDWPVSNKALEALINLCVDICKRNDIKELTFDGTKQASLTAHRYYAATTCPGNFLFSKFPFIASEVTRRLKEAEKPSIPSTGDNTILNKVVIGPYTYAEAKWKKYVLGKSNYKTIIVKNNRGEYFTQVASFKDKAAANELADKIKRLGHPKTFVSSNYFSPVEKEPQKPEPFKPYVVRVEIPDLNIRKGPGTKYQIVKKIPVGNYTIMEEKGGWGRLKSGEGWIALNYTKKI